MREERKAEEEDLREGKGRNRKEKHKLCRVCACVRSASAKQISRSSPFYKIPFHLHLSIHNTIP